MAVGIAIGFVALSLALLAVWSRRRHRREASDLSGSYNPPSLSTTSQNSGEGRPIMDWVTRVKVDAGAARGLAYLHEDCQFFFFFLNRLILFVFVPVASLL